MQTEKQKMLAGELYNVTDAQLQADQAAAAAWMARYNATGAQPAAQRHALLVERLAEVG
ncbi:maltose acetyltransferase domain-containing protein, partial [Xanthomonas phaseoli]